MNFNITKILLLAIVWKRCRHPIRKLTTSIGPWVFHVYSLLLDINRCSMIIAFSELFRTADTSTMLYCHAKQLDVLQQTIRIRDYVS